MGHKLQELTGEYDTASDGSEWYSKEEKRDILEVETPAAIACGEIPENAISRDSHSGIPFITDSYTSTMIVNPDDPDVKRMIEYQYLSGSLLKQSLSVVLRIRRERF